MSRAERTRRPTSTSRAGAKCCLSAGPIYTCSGKCNQGSGAQCPNRLLSGFRRERLGEVLDARGEITPLVGHEVFVREEIAVTLQGFPREFFLEKLVGTRRRRGRVRRPAADFGGIVKRQPYAQLFQPTPMVGAQQQAPDRDIFLRQ